MAKQTKLMIGVLAFLAILVGYNIWFFTRSKSASPPAKVRQSGSPARVAALPDPALDPPEVHFVTFPCVNPQRTRNPFLLPMEALAGKPYDQIEAPRHEEEEGKKGPEKPDLSRFEALLKGYELNGILAGRDSCLAIIQHGLYREGDLLDATFRIQKILDREVIVTAEGHVFQLKIRPVAGLAPRENR